MFLKASPQNGLKYFQINVNYLGGNYNIWEILFWIERRTCAKLLRNRLGVIQGLQPSAKIKVFLK